MTKNTIDESKTDSQSLLNQIILEYLHDQKRKRFWKKLFRIVLFIFLAWVAYQVMSTRSNLLALKSEPHVGLIDLKGTIFDSESGSSDNFAQGLEDAYDNSNMKALVIRIDSPGGSPVQADYMFNALRYYRDKYPDVKTYAVCVDTCASAAYYVAAAADEIYANPASIVGSIGVIYNGFGYVDTMEKLGVSRRLYTAGRYKGFMDQFSPEKPGEEAYLEKMLDTIHQQFIAKVKEGRGERLKVDDLTFSGLFWTGVQAKERGLIDGFGSRGQVAREVIKIDRVIDYTHEETVLDRFAKKFGASIANQLPESLGMKPGFR